MTPLPSRRRLAAALTLALLPSPAIGDAVVPIASFSVDLLATDFPYPLRDGAAAAADDDLALSEAAAEHAAPIVEEEVGAPLVKLSLDCVRSTARRGVEERWELLCFYGKATFGEEGEGIVPPPEAGAVDDAVRGAFEGEHGEAFLKEVYPEYEAAREMEAWDAARSARRFVRKRPKKKPKKPNKKPNKKPRPNKAPTNWKPTAVEPVEFKEKEVKPGKKKKKKNTKKPKKKKNKGSQGKPQAQSWAQGRPNKKPTQKRPSPAKPKSPRPPRPTPPAAPVPTSREADCSARGRECAFPKGAGISSWFTQELFDEMFPNLCAKGCEDACQMLTYPCLIQATLAYPKFANSGDRDDDKRELAAWLGIMGQETTGGGCQPPGTSDGKGGCKCSAPSWCDNQARGGCSRWGLCKVLEAGGTYCSPGGRWKCTPGKSYRGRGPKQLSWNYNYGSFSEDYCGDEKTLLDDPDRVATNPTLAWASSVWFWFTGGACDRKGGEKCKPSPHDVFTGKQKICEKDEDAGRKHGLGWAINVVNGGLECGSATGDCDYRVYSRVRFYRHYCAILGVDPLARGWTDEGNLFCGKMKNYAESAPGTC